MSNTRKYRIKLEDFEGYSGYAVELTYLEGVNSDGVEGGELLFEDYEV